MFEHKQPDPTASRWLEDLMTAHGTRILRLCTLYLKDAQLAEDAAQDTFLKAYSARRRFLGHSELSTWLTRIAINTCKDALRRPWRKLEEGEATLATLPGEEGLPDRFDDTVAGAVMTLKTPEKDVIVLRYYLEFSVKDIAKTLRLPVSTVKGRLARAKDSLRTALKGWYFDDTAIDEESY